MPLKNDYVNYSTHGICRVEEIRFMQFDRSSKGREYYILRPVHPDNIRIFVPMGNPHLANACGLFYRLWRSTRLF